MIELKEILTIENGVTEINLFKEYYENPTLIICDVGIKICNGDTCFIVLKDKLELAIEACNIHGK